MKLSYKILWIDDQIEDYIDMGIKEEFDNYLDDLGFVSTIDTFENGAKAKETLACEKYDLILSDYNIEGANEQGDTLIQKIRDEGVFTEILFYSAQENFEEIAKGLYRDRVSFFSLVGDEGMKGFRDRTYRLINLTIAKLQEVNSIRGLVMAETSELDNKIIDILNTIFEKEPKYVGDLRKYIIGGIQASCNSNSKKSVKIEDFENLEILKERLFDADKKARAINKLIEILGISEQEPFKDFYANYKKNVLDIRNDLAHAKSDIIDKVEYLIVSRPDGEHPEKFDQEKCISIRRCLRDYVDILKLIREKVE